MEFKKNHFIDALFANVFPDDPINQKARKIAARGVYSGGNCWLRREELEAFANYRRFLQEWNFTKSTAGGENEEYKVYCINPLTADSIRKIYNDNAPPRSLEGIISLCRACGVEDFGYIKAACAAFCEETLEGKGLRKILLYGAAQGFLAFDEIAYNRGDGTFGLLEQYYEKSLYERAESYERVHLPTKITDGTTVFLQQARDCLRRDEFMNLLDDETIREGFLYDKVELIMIVQDCLDKRRRTAVSADIREGDNALFRRYHAKALQPTYSRLCHGHKPHNDFFLSLALVFGFADGEIEKMVHSMHINAAGDGCVFPECCERIKAVNRQRWPKDDPRYDAALAELAATNEKSLPDFAAFLQKYRTELSQ